MIRAIIVDDEQLALQLMKKKLTDVGVVNVVKTFSDTESVISEMKNLDFNVAFLDVEMPGVSGLELAKLIKNWDKSILIIFVTAYRDYAIEAFDLHSIDYLLKPIMTNRLKETIIRIEEQLQKQPHEVPLHTKPVSPTINITCFNEFIVYDGTKPITWKTAKVKELFAYFITYLHSYINRDTLIEKLWPDHDYHKAKINLHTCISHLRKTLDDLGFKDALIFTNQSYTLKVDSFFCDAIELERVIDLYTNVTETNINEIEKSVHLYTGDYMGFNSYEWATGTAQTFKQKLLHLLRKMITFYTEDNMPDKTHHYLHLSLTLDPYSEQTLRQLILYYAENGNRAAAVKVYFDFTKKIQGELGISPDRTTTDLYNTICSS